MFSCSIHKSLHLAVSYLVSTLPSSIPVFALSSPGLIQIPVDEDLSLRWGKALALYSAHVVRVSIVTCGGAYMAVFGDTVDVEVIWP